MFETHVTPESAEVKIPPADVIATSLLPSAEQLASNQLLSGTECEAQFVPESAEVYMTLVFETVATSFAPSAEHATADHGIFGAPVWCQVAPESADAKIAKEATGAPATIIANNLV